MVIDRDRGEVCRRKVRCGKHVSVAVQRGAEVVEIIKVVVEVIDTNDNPPRFGSIFYIFL